MKWGLSKPTTSICTGPNVIDSSPPIPGSAEELRFLGLELLVRENARVAELAEVVVAASIVSPRSPEPAEPGAGAADRAASACWAASACSPSEPFLPAWYAAPPTMAVRAIGRLLRIIVAFSLL